MGIYIHRKSSLRVTGNGYNGIVNHQLGKYPILISIPKVLLFSNGNITFSKMYFLQENIFTKYILLHEFYSLVARNEVNSFTNSTLRILIMKNSSNLMKFHQNSVRIQKQSHKKLKKVSEKKKQRRDGPEQKLALEIWWSAGHCKNACYLESWLTATCRRVMILNVVSKVGKENGDSETVLGNHKR